MLEKLKDIALFLKWATISREYFSKSSSWMYQRLGGYDVNNKPAEFTPEETLKLKEALYDISRRIIAAADAL